MQRTRSAEPLFLRAFVRRKNSRELVEHLEQRRAASAGGRQHLLTSEPLTGTPMVAVVATKYPLAASSGMLPRTDLAKHVELVLTDRSTPSEHIDSYVLSSSTWRLADLFAKRAFLLEGLRWGFMPRHVVNDDLAAMTLVSLSLRDIPSRGLIRPVSAVYLTASPPGPAGRWFIDQIKAGEAPEQSKLAEAKTIDRKTDFFYLKISTFRYVWCLSFS